MELTAIRPSYVLPCMRLSQVSCFLNLVQMNHVYVLYGTRE